MTALAYDNDYEDPEVEELRSEVRRERHYRQRLTVAPSCRDPDHPGCPDCCEGDSEDAGT